MTLAPDGRKLLRIEARNTETPIERKPEWIKTRAVMGPEYTRIRSLVKAEGMYFSSHGNQSKYGTLTELVNRNCIDSSLLTEARNYYTFQVNLSSPITYSINATPDAGLASQMRYFYGDETGVIRQATGTTATIASPPIN